MGLSFRSEIYRVQEFCGGVGVLTFEKGCQQVSRLGFSNVLGPGDAHSSGNHTAEPRRGGHASGSSARDRSGRHLDVEPDGRQRDAVEVLGGVPRLLDVCPEVAGDGRIVEEAEQKVIGSDSAVSSPRCFFCGVRQRGCRRRCDRSRHLDLLPVFGVNRLAGYAKRIADLLPRPALRSGGANLMCLNLLCHPVKGTDSAQADRRIRRLESGFDAFVHHVVSLA